MVGEGGLLGDAILPDEFHRGFRLRLPANLPPSSIFLSPDTSMGPRAVGDSPWGLTYYLYAYISHPHSSFTQSMDPWYHQKGTKKSSKVFLSFTRSLVSHAETLLQLHKPPAMSVSKTLMPSSKPIKLDAALEKAFFYANDSISVHVKIDNPRGAKIGGLRITLKQLITTRCLNEAKQITKVPLAVYEFPVVDENGKFVAGHAGHQFEGGLGVPLKDYPFVIDTVRVTLKPGNFLQQVAVESRLPRTAIRELMLAPSFHQNYDFGNSNLRFYSIEYYMNVHVIVPWGTNLIAKLPFTVASRGAGESLYASDNLTSLAGSSVPVETSINEEDEDDEDLFKAKANKTTNKINDESANAEMEKALNSFPRERFWREFDSSLKLFDRIRRKETASNFSQFLSLDAFEASRRTWTRELAEAGMEVKVKIDLLAALVPVTDAQFPGINHVPSPMNASAPKDLLESLTGRFIPAYRKLVSCHEQAEHRDAMLEALNSLLDTLELVFMKYQLSLPVPVDANSQKAVIEVDADFSGFQLFGLIRGRLERDFLRLILVIPGVVEWRWFLEGLASWALQGGQFSLQLSPQDAQIVLSDALLYAANEGGQGGEEDLNFSLASQFQGIHTRLSQSFSDARIEPTEIVQYGRLLATIMNNNTTPAQQARIAACHYAYFKTAMFVYFGAFGSLLLPFDALLQPQRGPSGGDLKALREELTPLRQALIKSMQS